MQVSIQLQIGIDGSMAVKIGWSILDDDSSLNIYNLIIKTCQKSEDLFIKLVFTIKNIIWFDDFVVVLIIAFFDLQITTILSFSESLCLLFLHSFIFAYPFVMFFYATKLVYFQPQVFFYHSQYFTIPFCFDSIALFLYIIYPTLIFIPFNHVTIFVDSEFIVLSLSFTFESLKIIGIFDDINL